MGVAALVCSKLLLVYILLSLGGVSPSGPLQRKRTGTKTLPVWFQKTPPDPPWGEGGKKEFLAFHASAGYSLAQSWQGLKVWAHLVPNP